MLVYWVGFLNEIYDIYIILSKMISPSFLTYFCVLIVCLDHRYKEIG